MVSSFIIDEPRALAAFKISELFGRPEIAVEIHRNSFVDGDIPVVSAGRVNCGISARIKGDYKLYEDCLTIDCFGYCVYREYAFYASRVYVLPRGHYSPEVAMYIASSITASLSGRYNFMNRFTLSEYDNASVYLPVDEAGKIDVPYMTDYIKRVQLVQRMKMECLGGS